MSSEALAALRIPEEPYYVAAGNEIELYTAAYSVRMPVMLKGPTGCGKTRFVQYMAWRLGKPLVTVACNEEMSASDLLGRYLLEGGGTRWQDGPLTSAARLGAICYLDEVAEARQDTLVVIHPLTDDRRLLSLPAKSEIFRAHSEFQLVVSHNPGYQSALKELKPSTKQRFAAIEFEYPGHALEVEIVSHETGVARDLAERLVRIAEAARRLRGHGLDEGVSTRMLVHAGSLIRQGIAVEAACQMALVRPLTDDADLILALNGCVRACL